MKIVSNDYVSNLPGAKKLPQGGPKIFARHISEYASSHGHQWVGLLHGYTETGRVSVRELKRAKNREYYSLVFPTERYLGFMRPVKKVDPEVVLAKEIERTRVFLREQRPDIVFLNGFDVFVWILLRAAAAEKIPVVVQHAGIAKLEFLAYSHLSTAVGRKVLLEMERDLVRYSDREVFLNDQSRQMFTKLVAKVPTKKARIIPLPYKEMFAAAKPKKQKTSLTGEIVHFGCVARWDRIKNHPGLLRLAKTAHRAKRPWVFESVTKIPDTPIQAEMKQEYREHINVLPAMEQEDLAHFYREQDFMVLPSHFETAGGVVMEAALAGTPTFIAPNVGWADDYKACGLSDLVINFSNGKKMLERIDRVLRHPPSLLPFQQMIRRAHQPSLVFEAYLRLFHETIS